MCEGSADGATAKLIFARAPDNAITLPRWKLRAFGLVRKVGEIVFFTLRALIPCRYILNAIRARLCRQVHPRREAEEKLAILGGAPLPEAKLNK